MSDATRDQAEHPSLVEIRERDARALAQGYTEGDVNHYTQPILGMLRLRQHQGEPLSEDDLAWAIKNLDLACNAEIAWLLTAGQEHPAETTEEKHV